MIPDAQQPKNVSAVEYIRANFHPSDRLAVLVRGGTSREVLQREYLAVPEGTPAEWR